MSAELLNIPLKQIRENPDALRKVNEKSQDFIGLTDSIKEVGVMNSITVTRLDEKDEDGNDVYRLIDGLHRFKGSIIAGRADIPAQVLSGDELQIYVRQIIANVQNVATKPSDYSKGLRRLLAASPLMTESELATMLGKSPAWLQQRLGLLEIEPKIMVLVDEGKIVLSNAYLLAKLPAEEQVDWIERASTEAPIKFAADVKNRIKDIAKAKREGKTPGEVEFRPTAVQRKVSEIKAELEAPQIGAILCKENKLKSAEEGFAMGLKFCVQLDPKSIEGALAKEDARKAKREEDRSARAAERKAKKVEEAEKKVTELKADAEKATAEG